MSSISSRRATPAGSVTFQDALDLHRGDRLEEATSAYRSVLTRDPRNADATALLGVALVQSGSAEEGILALTRALALQPRNPTFLYNLGVACERAGRLEESQAAHARALEVDPRSRVAWSARAGALRSLGRWQEAVACCRKAVELAPGDAEAWNDLGVALEKAGDLAGASNAFRNAVLRDGGDALAATNLATVLEKQGSSDSEPLSERLDLLWRNVHADPGDPTRWSAFTDTFKSVATPTAEAARQLMPVLLACLLQDGVDHRPLTRVGLSITHAHPDTGALLEVARQGEAAVDAMLGRQGIWAALAHPAIRLLLERTVVPDADWELLFTRVRRHLAVVRATSAGSEPPPEGMEQVAFSIARQCFQNGYVWPWDDAETAGVEGLVPTMAGRGLGTHPGDRLRMAILASYVPLLEWERAGEVVAWSDAAEEDASLRELVRQQIREPTQEEGLKELIPTFGKLATRVSAEVQEMYEEHPYPRWLSLKAVKPAPAADVLRGRFPWARTDRLAAVERPRVLVAGCGTGEHLMRVAGRFQGAQVTGVDLSRASLAYAVRKAGELGFEDVSVVQADILALDAWTEPFHVIECAGVLHHMEDPMAGWRVLERLLVPGGFMKIGLYSETARRSVVEARAYIAEQGWAATPEDIRRARPQIVRRFADASVGSPARWRDFFNMHECRDLLFHVQEHRFTIPRIADALDTLGLTFVGWDALPGTVLEAFRARFPEPSDHRSLEAWHRFETENPDTFSSMYQFWIWKPVP